MSPRRCLLALLLAACDGGERTAARGGGDDLHVANGAIVFPATDDRGRQQLFRIDPGGGARQQLTFGDEASMPSFSPDGERIVYVARQAPGVPSMLWIMDADGGNQHALVQGDSPDWGPGDRLAFAAPGGPGQPPEIFMVGLDGAAPRRLTEPGGHAGRVHPSWSPDGSELVFVQLVPQDPAGDDTANRCPALPVRVELAIVGADGSGLRQLTELGEINVDDAGATINSAADANSPDWSLSGGIAFWSGQEACNGQVWTVHPDGSGRRQLTHAPLPSHNDDPAWSPDGTRLLFSTDRRGRPELWMMNADGSDAHFVADNRPGPGPADAAWQPIVR